jgi:hypothetical protein
MAHHIRRLRERFDVARRERIGDEIVAERRKAGARITL